MGNLANLRIALAQIEVHQGQPKRNLDTMRASIDRARADGAQLVVFPRMDAGLTERDSLEVAAMTKGIAAIWGDHAARDGRLMAPDAPYLVLDGGFQGDVLIDVGGRAVSDGGTGICPHDLVVFSDAGPWTMRSEERVSCSMPSVRVNAVGTANYGHEVLAFDGGSDVRVASGATVARLRDDFESDYRVVSLNRIGDMARPDATKLLDALVKTMRRFDEQVFPWKPAWIIGLSGGLDSSVTACLLTLAFGSDRVAAYNLATKYNSEATRRNAEQLADALGLRLRSGSIKKLVKATADTVGKYGYSEGAVSGLVLENVQARVRGHLLSTFAALEGGVVVNNGNRVECALGYATLYGDAVGALSPIGDLTKVNLFGLARNLNRALGVGAVPENLLPRETDDGFKWKTMPSAELSDGQRDPMKWFYHDWLVSQLLDVTGGDPEPIVERYREDRLLGTEVGKWIKYYKLDDPKRFEADLEWVLHQMRTSVYKRIQAPPRIAIASPASVHAKPEAQG